jgi:murein hydrolase activator
MKLPLALLLLLPGLCPPPAARAQQAASAQPAAPEEKKEKLDAIGRQLEEKRRELDAFRAEEERISAELAGLRREEKQGTARRAELESQLDRARSHAAEARSRYESLEKTRKALAGDLPGELLMFSLQKDFFYPYYGTRDLSKDLLLRYALFGKSALLNSIKGESRKVNRDLSELSARSLDLRARQELLRRQSSAQKNAMQVKQEELARTRSQQARLAAEVENLQNAAAGLTRLVKTLQKRAPYRQDTGPADLPIPQRSLPWPAEGRLISRYGRESVPELKTWIVREGVRIAVPQEGPVKAVLAGRVIYSGPFRTYGNVVIVDHEKGFFTIYGLLSRIDAQKGQVVEALSPLGLAGEDTQAVGQAPGKGESAVYFEIRKGDRSLDPMKWLAN